MAKYQLTEKGVIDLEEGGHIPNDPLNIGWQSYKEWEAFGNTPDPAEPDYVQTDEDRLNDSDFKMVRAVDWLLQQLVKQGTLKMADIPPALKTLYLERKAQRGE